jgi:hypothetical protein
MQQVGRAPGDGSPVVGTALFRVMLLGTVRLARVEFGRQFLGRTCLGWLQRCRRGRRELVHASLSATISFS